MAEPKNVKFYKDELEDDFANNANIKTVKIDGKYKYVHKNLLWNIASFIVYRIIVAPWAFMYSKIKFRLKIEGKEKIKEYRKNAKKGFFIYQNHTQEILDTLLPAFISFPKKAYIIASPNNVSIKGLKIANKMMGALPIPGDKTSTKNFLDAIKYYIKKEKVISIYPEAHVWPYYTGIRNFKVTSFKYPIENDVPVFACTTTYQEYKKGKTRVVIYIDGPIYYDKSLTHKEAKEDLRNEVYNTMLQRAKKSNIEIIKYVKLGDKYDD